MSAVQFRDGGVKGVLSVVNDSSLDEFEIRERVSMIKIQSENREFCVLKVLRPYLFLCEESKAD